MSITWSNFLANTWQMKQLALPQKQKPWQLVSQKPLQSAARLHPFGRRSNYPITQNTSPNSCSLKVGHKPAEGTTPVPPPPPPSSDHLLCSQRTGESLAGNECRATWCFAECLSVIFLAAPRAHSRWRRGKGRDWTGEFRLFWVRHNWLPSETPLAKIVPDWLCRFHHVST